MPTQAFPKVKVLDLQSVGANVTVSPGSEVTVTVEGPEALRSKIRTSVQGNRLVITGGQEPQGGTTITVSGRGNTVSFSGRNVTARTVVSGGNISIIGGRVISDGPITVIENGGPDAEALKITVTVPLGTEILSENVKGTLTIGDTEGPVQISAKHQQTVSVGKVGNAVLSTGGQSEIIVLSLNGSAWITTSGQSRVTIKGGQITALTVGTSGQSEARVKGIAQTANLWASGQSKVRVREVVNRPVRSRSGQADVDVDNW